MPPAELIRPIGVLLRQPGTSPLDFNLLADLKLFQAVGIEHLDQLVRTQRLLPAVLPVCP